MDAGDSKLRVNYGFNRLRFPAPIRRRRGSARASRQRRPHVEGGIEIAWGVVVEIEGRQSPRSQPSGCADVF